VSVVDGAERRSNLTGHSVTGLVERAGTNRSPVGHGPYAAPVRVVIAPGSFGDTLGAAAAADAIATGWRRAAPGDDLALLPAAGGVPPGLDAALDGAGVVVTGEASFDWRSLRGAPVPAVAQAAAARSVPCVVLAGQVLVGRREAAAVGVDAAYAVSEATYAVSDRVGVADGPAADPAGALAALAEDVARRWSR
jgi:glycerate kinase